VLGGIYFSDRVVLLQKIAQQVAATMEFVHSRDVVHRDLKPVGYLLDCIAMRSRRA